MTSSSAVPQLPLGKQGFVVSKQGLGCSGMSIAYGPPKPDQDMIDLIRYAVENGVTLIDTADVYGPFTNEILIGKAIKGIRHKVQLATKFGCEITEDFSLIIRGHPAYIRSCLEGSLKRLEVDYIDLYYQHRVDPKVPIEISVGVMKEFVEAGKIKYIGLSEASGSEIRRAHAVHPITAVQLEYSLWTRDIEEDVIPTCRELGIGIVPYSPLGRGFFAGVKADQLGDDDFRKALPRFQVDNMERNKEFYDRLVAIGKKKNVTPGQLALAWVQHQGHDIVPIPGTTRRKNLDENIASVAIHLSPEDSKEIEDSVPLNEVAGARYDEGNSTSTWNHARSPPLSAWNHETNELYPDWNKISS